MCRALLLIAGLLLLASGARADTAVLRNEQRLHITGTERLGETVRLDLPGGSALLPADDLVSVQPEEFFPANAPPTLRVVRGIAPTDPRLRNDPTRAAGWTATARAAAVQFPPAALPFPMRPRALEMPWSPERHLRRSYP